jgi:hypothetical protein
VLVQHRVPTRPVCRVALHLIEDGPQLLYMSHVLPAAKVVAADGNDHFICAPSPVNGVLFHVELPRCGDTDTHLVPAL